MKLKKKLMAVILTIVMLMSYLSTLGSAVIAATTNLLEENSKTNNANVEFNSYFEGGEYSKTFEIGEEAKLYIKLKVSNTGYLKNGIVQFADSNFEIDSNNLKSDIVQSSSKNEIKLKQINNSDNETVIEVPITMVTRESIDSEIFDKIATVSFTGTYIDENGKENAIEKKIEQEVKWKGTAEIELAGNVEKFLPYEIGNEKGVLLQVKVNSGIKDNSLPVATTKLEVSIPELKISEEKSLKPERVTVVANTTKGTNGKGSNEFDEANYTYNAETGRIEIEVNNEVAEGKISWNKKAIDEYVVSYFYTGEEIYNSIKEQLAEAEKTIKTEEEKEAGEENENAITGEIEVGAEIEAYNSEETKINKDGKIEYSIEKTMGDVVDSKISGASKVSKGYIYANFAKSVKEANEEDIEEKKETGYEVGYTAKIYDCSLTQEIEFDTVSEKYVDSEEKEYSSKVESKEGIYSKVVKIDEDVFNKMLGENGKIEVTSKEGNKLGEITKDSEKDEVGKYILNIEETKVNEIVIKTSKVITEGEIVLTVEKAISSEQSYSKEEIESFEKMVLGLTTKSYINVVEINNETETSTEEQEEVITNLVEATQNNKTTEIKLAEPVSKAEISVGTESLSTVVKNENVELRVVLDTSSIENALYKNPILKIVLPENIKTVDIKSADILLDDELKIKETKVIEQSDRKVIQVLLEGTQTKYMDNNTSKNTEEQNVIAKGTNIVIKADITFNNLAPSANANILLYYTNENTNLYEKTSAQDSTNIPDAITEGFGTMGMASADIQIKSPNGVVAENHISGYDGSKSINNSTADKQEETVEVNETAKEVTIGGTIINNYANSVENVFVLGRIPFSGNKQIDGTEELGSNFTMKMTNKLTVSGIDCKVYYSTNGEATKDLIDVANGWTEEPSNLSEVKSYLIVVTGEVTTGSKFSFNYNAELPANLTYSSSSYTTYKVYYDNKMEDATLGETKVAGLIGLVTGAVPSISVELSSKTSTVREGQIVRMVATIKNNGDSTVENAKLQVTAPEGTVHTEIEIGTRSYTDSTSKEKTIIIGNIKAGETITKDYQLRIEKGTTATQITNPDTGDSSIIYENKYPGDKEIQNMVIVSADNVEKEIKSAVYTLKVTEGDLSIVNIPNPNETEVLNNGKIVRYTIKLENISYDKDLTNTTLNVKLPSGVKINDIYYSDSLTSTDKNTNGIEINGDDIKINIGTLQSFDAYMAELTEAEAEDEDQDENDTTDTPQLVQLRDETYVYIEFVIDGFAGEYDCIMTATADNIDTHYSNVIKLYSESVKLKFSQKELDKKYVKEGSTYTCTFTIENIGEISSISNKMEMTIPEGLSFVKAEYTTLGQKMVLNNATDGHFAIEVYELEPGKSLDITVTVKADLLPDKNDKTVTTVATLEASGFEKIESNTVDVIIEYDESAHQTGGSIVSGRYKITGTAWIDENKDGKRDETEELLSGVQVLLIYKSNSGLVTDANSGEKKIVTTDKEGKYEFSNLLPDEYLVVFLYDAGKYNITDYQKDEVSEAYNSDATNMKIVLDGEQKYAGVTDIIKITNTNARDIDIGLYVAKKFDLRLDKYITKITVTTPSSGTKVYNYNNSKLTKREIYSKDVNNSSLVVEYKIVITNEGQIDGYVKTIIDYLPEDAKFSSELNKDWYISNNNGVVYNTALANEKIVPGESKEVNLILSFSITDKNIGTLINNNAEIYESYNEQGMQDYDSQEANRLESEDDMSNADIMLSLATGKIILYTTLVIAIIILLGFGVYEIRRRVLIKREN